MADTRTSTDPRPRNAQGQYASGTTLGPQDMNRAYGFRLRTLRAILGKRRNHTPVVTPQDVQRLATLAARSEAMLIELEKFHLGTTPENVPATCCAPPSPAPIRFPQLYVDGTRALPLPKSGKAVIEYRVRSTSSHDDAEGNERHSTGIEVHSIEPIAEDEPEDLPGKARQLAARAHELVELAMPAAASSTTRNDLSRRGLATLLRMGRSKARRMYPAATQRARNAVARAYAEKRAATGFSGRVAQLAARTGELIEFSEPPHRVQFVEEGGYTRLVRSDGSKTTLGRAPGLKNRLKRHPVAVAAGAAATAGAGTVLLRRALQRGRAK